jgi:hypothetical protein
MTGLRRQQLRCLFTRAISQVKETLHAYPLDKVEIESLLKVVEDKANCVFKLHEEISDLWLCKDEFEGEANQKDYEGTQTYRDEYIMKTRHENMFQHLDMDQIRERSCLTIPSLNRKFCLPKLELKKLDCDVENWLGFWGQFIKIND